MLVAGTAKAKDILPVQAQVKVKGKAKDTATRLSHYFTFRNYVLSIHNALW